MKIGMIGQKGIPATHGGIERHVHGLSSRLANKGHDVSVYSRKWYQDKNIESIDNVKAIFTPTINTKHLDAITHTFTSTIHALFQKYDILHYHGVGPSLLAWIPRIFSSAKVITTFHCIDRKHKKWNWFARLSLHIGEWACCKLPHETITVSKALKKYVKKNYNCDADYIPNGVPLYKKTTSIKNIKQWGLKKQNYLLIISRFVAHKGIHYAIKAYKEIKKKYPEKLNKKLVIVGGGHHTSNYVKKLHKMGEDEEDIVFTGFQSGETLKELFSNAYMMLAPSDHEGLPITVLEGMSYELPILASNIEEHKELIDNSDFTFKQGSVGSMKNRLLSLVNKTDKLKKEAQRNRDKIKADFEWDIIADRTEKLYKKILKT